MKGLRKVLRVSWTAKKTNEWVLNKAGVKKELLDTVKARKLQGGASQPDPSDLLTRGSASGPRA